MIYILSEKDYIEKSISAGLKKHWYGWARGWTDGKDIYINNEAFYINDWDKSLLISHEEGHVSGKQHTVLGLMSPYGLLRFLTCWL